MAVTQRGDQLHFDVTVTARVQTPAGVQNRRQRFRVAVLTYVRPRLAPEDRPPQTKQEAARLWETQFTADCTAFLRGLGPDPRVAAPLVTPEKMTVSDLMDEWFKVLKTRDLRSEGSVKSKMEFCRKWYDARPIADLELTQTHEAFLAYLMERGCTKATRNRYIASVIRPMVFWAAFRTPPLLKSVPFGKHRLTTSAKGEAKRTRRCLVEEEARLLAALKRMLPESDTYRRMHDFTVALIDLGTRPLELLSVQNRDVDWTNGCINLPPETTKTGVGRSIPFNPNGRVAEVLKRRRFLKPDAFVFGALDGSMPGAGTARGTEEFGVATLNLFRPAWQAAVLVAAGHTLSRRRSSRHLGASLFSKAERIAYRAVDLRTRDLRHEAASRWAEQGLKFQEIQYMLGHAGGITSRYVQVLLGPLKESLAKTVWPHDGEAERLDLSESGAGQR